MSDFQVIILAGGTGSRMHPVSDKCCKHLLPVANRPLISFQLDFLAKSGFETVTVLTSTECAVDLKKYVNEIYKGKISVVWEILKGPITTTEALLKIKDNIKGDFIVMSGDLIVEGNFIPKMMDIHRTRDCAVTMLLKKPSAKEAASEEDAKKKKKDGSEGDYIGMTEDQKVVFFSAKADIEDTMVIHKSILRKYPAYTLNTHLLDAHFYIFSRWVLDVLQKYEKTLGSIKGELIPFLVQLQTFKTLKKSEIPVQKEWAMSMSSSSKSESDGLDCYAVILQNEFCIRVNTIPSYFDANREIARGIYEYQPLETPGKNNFVASSSAVSPKTQVGPECVVGEGTKVGDRCGVKKSNIGKHCVIGNNVKITNSIIMDHVTLKDGCNIQNSVICANAFIEENCNITQCQVGYSYSMEAGSTHKSETLGDDGEELTK